MAFPSLSRQPLLTREIAATSLQAILPIFAGVIAMRKEKLAWAAYDRVVFWVAFTGVVMTTLAAGFRIIASYYKDKKEADAASPTDLSGCLHVLHRVIYKAKGLDPSDPKVLRLTVHKVEADVLVQLVDYVGGDAEDDAKHGRAARREFSIHTGMIGRVARLGEPRILDRPGDHTFDAWVRYLVEHLGMREADAKGTNPNRYSFCAVPLVSNGRVDAVLYLDASTTEFFDSATEQLVLEGCAGLSKYANLRYG